MNSIKQLWTALVNPTVRLQVDFPWTISKLGTTYIIALVFFIVGTFLPVIAFSAVVAVLAYFNVTAPLDWISNDQAGFLAVMMVTTFASGFGAEIWYLSRALRKDGFSLSSVLALNTRSLNGSWRKVILYSLLTFGAMALVNELVSLIPMPKVVDPAANIVKQMTGWKFLALALLVSTGPFLEEVVFRGFLYNVLRSSLRNGRLANAIRTQGTADFLAALLSGLAFAIAHMNLSGFLFYLAMGMVLSEAYRRSGTLWVPVIAHSINNTIIVVSIAISMFS